MSIFDRALHIPAERLFFQPQDALHERVLLPLTARPSARFYGAVLLAGLAAVACFGMGMAFAIAPARGQGALVFAIGFLAAALLPAATLIAGARDALHPVPVLVIDRDGMRDLRLGAAEIAWRDVVAAELVASGSGIQAVRLTLAQEGAALFNPFRIGGWSAEWAQRRRTRVVALMLLDTRAHVLAHTMLALAARHGATIAQPTPWQIQPHG